MKKKEETVEVYELDFGDATNAIDRNLKNIIAWINTDVKDMKVGDELNYTITKKVMNQKDYENLPDLA